MANSAMVVATTARTKISKISLADAPFIFDLMQTPDWIKYIGNRNLANLADAERHLQSSFLSVYREHGFGYYLIRNLMGESVGVAGFLKKPYLQNEDYGFAFMPSSHNQGFAYEVSQTLLQYGQTEFGFHVLDAVTLQSNLASQKLLEKLSFANLGKITLPDTNEKALLYRWLA